MKDGQTALFKRADHANLGREWENELTAVHDWYRLQGRADIVKNPHDWVFVTEKQYRAKLSKYGPAMFARVGTGAIIMRSRSDVDFSGGGRGFSVCFDAKTSKGKSFPLAGVEYHQIHRLLQSGRCGVTSGFMIRMSEVDRVFFVPAAVMDKKYTTWQASAGRGARAKPGTASLSIDELERDGVEILRNPRNGMWDWLDRLAVDNRQAAEKHGHV